MATSTSAKIPYRVKDLTGRRFGRLVAKRWAGVNKHRQSMWLCLCDCGEKVAVNANNLTGDKTKSCGCLYLDTRKTCSATHGGCYEPEYGNWRGMMKRCYDPKHKSYYRYGAKGVKVQETWHDYLRFKEYVLAHLGKRPSPSHSIDRFPNQSGNYEEGNIRWATPSQQQRNMKSNVMLTYDGKTLCIAAWTEIKGWSRSKIQNRRRAGWNDERILSTP